MILRTTVSDDHTSHFDSIVESDLTPTNRHHSSSFIGLQFVQITFRPDRSAVSNTVATSYTWLLLYETVAILKLLK